MDSVCSCFFESMWSKMIRSIDRSQGLHLIRVTRYQLRHRTGFSFQISSKLSKPLINQHAIHFPSVRHPSVIRGGKGGASPPSAYLPPRRLLFFFEGSALLGSPVGKISPPVSSFVVVFLPFFFLSFPLPRFLSSIIIPLLLIVIVIHS